MNDNTDTETISRDFVRQLFDRSNKIEITDQGVTAEDMSALFNNNTSD